MTHSFMLGLAVQEAFVFFWAFYGLIRCKWQAAEIADLRAQLAKEIQS